MNRNPGRAFILRRLRWVVGLAILSMLFDAAALRRIEPGKPAELTADEALLVVAFDTDIVINSARFEKTDRALVAGLLNNLPAGRNIELYAVPAGKYRWERIKFAEGWSGYKYYDLSKSREYEFDVLPGRISYAGDLMLRGFASDRALLHIANRSVPVIDWLKAQHPQLLQRYRFAYSGLYPDPFPEFYEDALARTTNPPADPNAGLAPPKPGALPLLPEVLWRAAHVRDQALSPDGSLAAIEVREPGGKYGLDLIDLAAGSAQRLLTSPYGFGEIVWKSERTLLAGVGDGESNALSILHIGDAAAGKRKFVHLQGPVGSIVHLLPKSPGRILFQSRSNSGNLMVVEMQLDNQQTVDKFKTTRLRDRLNKGFNNDIAWFADGAGRLRAAMVRSGEDIVLMYGQPGQYREIMRYGMDNDFDPLKLSDDGNVIYGLSDAGRAQRDLVEFDPAQAKITKTLYSRPGVDIVAPLFDENGGVIGASYYESGGLVSHYFDEANSRLETRLQKLFPGRSVLPLQRSRDGRKMLLWVDASDVPPALYYLDLDRKSAQLLNEYYPQLSGMKFARSELLRVPVANGATIDAFVTMPSGAGKRPLVVMPHGGPIGVADRLHFDREAQFVATLGYAVLQVNFRGSDGYGRAFREAGHGQYGTGIEDDIDAAMKAALAKYPLDADRICILGTSYGGYSAMISSIRWPNRFRCAVSMSGVSDRMLVFTASDSARSANGRRILVELMGDPRERQHAFVQASPLYRYRELTTPLMLVHGREDRRVDFEHTRRLVRMLNLDRRPPVVLAFAGEGHGLSGLESNAIAWEGVAGFLRRHLESAAPPSAAQGK